ncbi:MAG: dockerin type I domain-containing protein [Phycisphaerales bacterium]|nr:dockerin type I domain-containing protein [Phycisphaerales bacterium]
MKSAWIAAMAALCLGVYADAGDDKLLCDPLIQDIDLGLDGCRSIAADGSTVVLQQQGSEFDLPNSLRFFNNIDGQWVEDVDQQLELPAWNGTYFPRKYLAMSGDTILCSIGMIPNYVMVIERGGSGWDIQQILDPPFGSSDDFFGQHVAIDGDGAAVSDIGANGGGVINIYRRSAWYWSLDTQLTSSVGQNLGSGIAIEGNRIIAGSSGGVHAFEYDGSTWSETQVFGGNSTGMDLQGDQAIVGNNIYARVDGEWVIEQELPSPVGGDDTLSWSDAYISGTLAAYNVEDSDDGGLYTIVYEHDGTEWVHVDSIPCSAESENYPSPFEMIGRNLLMGYVTSGAHWKFGRLLTYSFPDTAEGTDVDCNGNGQCDSLDLASLASFDCDGNGIPDACDLADGVHDDVNGNGIPDICESDCDGDGVPDEGGKSSDCNGNGIPDACDIADGHSPDLDGDGVPDECDQDAVLVVSGDGTAFFDDIQDALDVSLSGATISVEPGIYVGPYVLPQHPVSLVSTGGPEETQLLPPSADARVMTIPLAGPDTLVEGFSMGGSTGMLEGGGLLLVDSAAVLRDCVFLNNEALRGAGTMVIGRHASDEPCRFEQCVWRGNVSTSEDFNNAGGGLACINALLTLEQCEIIANVGGFTGGGLWFVEGTEASISDCLFKHNVSNVSGSAGSFIGATAEVSNSFFCGNEEVNGDSYSDLIGTWVDGGGNEFLDACPGECPGDANGDGVVDVTDLLAVIYDWGVCDPEGVCSGDLNGDGLANVDDLLMVIANWGTSCDGELFGGCTGDEDVNEADFGCVCSVDGDDPSIDCNGGLNTDGTLTPYTMGQTVCGNASVFYAANGNIWRDTDWWDDFGVLDAGGTFTLEIGSGASQILGIVDLDSFTFADGVINPEGEIGAREITLPPGNYCIWTGPSDWNQAWTCESGLADYVFSIVQH